VQSITSWLDFGDDDSITAADGDNVILGGFGADTVTSGAGDDIVIGDNGNVTFTAGVASLVETTDTTTATGGDDDLDAGNGDNMVLGGIGADTLYSGSGHDVLAGDNARITLAAGVVTDVISLDASSLTTGNDEIVAGDGENLILGGGGSDTIASGADDSLILGDNGEMHFSPAGTVQSITSWLDFGDDDSIAAAGGDNVIFGGFGADTVTSGAGDDIVFGDNGHVIFAGGLPVTIATSDVDPSTGGDDDLRAGDGDNIVLAGVGSDFVQTGTGRDMILGDNGIVNLDSQGRVLTMISGDPRLGGDDELRGGAGDDAIIGGAFSDIIDGEDGRDALIGDAGKVTYRRGVLYQVETLDRDRFIGGDDTITGGAGNDIMFGGAGNDLFYGNFSEDLMVGDYARVTLNNGTVETLIRLGQDELDLIGRRQITLYVPDNGQDAQHSWDETRRSLFLEGEQIDPLEIEQWQSESQYGKRRGHHDAQPVPSAQTQGEAAATGPVTPKAPAGEAKPVQEVPVEEMQGTSPPQSMVPVDGNQAPEQPAGPDAGASSLEPFQLEGLQGVVAGLTGWGLASGRRRDGRQRLASEDLQRFAQPQTKSWRWADGQLQDTDKAESGTQGLRLVNMREFALEKKHKTLHG
jgi:Ca2+-binding RTX toxin-like protein